MSRRKGPEKERVSFFVRKEVLVKFKLLAYDPTVDGTSYGSFSSTVDKLLEKLVEARQNGKDTIFIGDVLEMLN